MSFRNRLALFFVVIVIVPMLAVAFLLFRLIDESAEGQAEAAISQRHTFASTLFRENRKLAGVAIKEVARDRVFSGSLQQGDIERAQRRAEQLLESRAIERIVFVKDGKAVVRAGDRLAVAPAVRNVVSEADRTPLGTLGVSVIDAPAYVANVRRLAGMRSVVLNGKRLLATSLPDVAPDSLPARNGAQLEVGDTEYRVQHFEDEAPFSGQNIRVFTLGDPDVDTTTDEKLFAGGVLLGFFLLAIACAVLVSRTLQQQIAEFLTAARRLAGGDFSAKVPTVGHDEFADLGEEFNKMSAELERRLAELSRERERVQASMLRLGDAVGKNLDRDALLEIVVNTAVDGVGADAGRACVRANGSTVLEERSRVGNMNGLESAVSAVEAEAMRRGTTHEATIAGATAIANPLRGDGRNDVVGVVSVGRTGGPFSASDRELFKFLADRAARSIENVEVYETVSRQSVTDHLTGLLNRRAFDETLAREIERARRFDTPLGMVLMDLDDFGMVNKTYSHPSGDAVLREVARVLRDSSREKIDIPARYGGEELAVILPGTDLEGAYNRAERIREQIEQLRIPRVDGAGTIRVTASCGVASVRGEGADVAALVNAADAAEREAKRRGKNTSVRAR